MFRKVSLKTIFILLAVLLILVVGVNLMDKMKGNRSFKSELVEFEADQINKIVVAPKVMRGKQVNLTKEGDQWFVSSGGNKFNAERRMVESILNDLNHLKPESVASTKKARWGYYQVNDSLGTRVQLFNGTDLKADIILGKFSFSSQREPKSYVRMADDQTTYGVQGYNATTFNRPLDEFKDKTVIHGSKGDWDKLNFTYPADSSFVLTKANQKWTIPGVAADSAKVSRYLSSIQNLTQYQLSDKIPEGSPSFTLKIDGKGTSIEVKGFLEPNNDLVVSSSQNPGIYFKGNTIREKLFPPQSQFVKTK